MGVKTTFADCLKLVRLIIVRAFQLLVRFFYKLPFFKWLLSGSIPDQILIAPQDITTADPIKAKDFYEGYFTFAGHSVNVGGLSPFEQSAAPLLWRQKLNGFKWLKHLRAAKTHIARMQAQALVDDFIRHNKLMGSVAWYPEVAANRVMAWLVHAPMLVEGADHAFYRRYMRSLARQVRYLRLSLQSSEPGFPRLLIVIALSYAAIGLSSRLSTLKSALKRLDKELSIQILPDGGHISRNPEILIRILALLLPLKQAILARNIAPGEALLRAMDRMMPMLRFFRLGDGTFANFNGMGETPGDLLATMLSFDEAAGDPVLNATHSGYQRLYGGDVVVLMDTGALPAFGLEKTMHAGALSFELSADREPIIKNCGHMALSSDHLQVHEIARVVRSTAAHSTLSIAGQSSCTFIKNDKLTKFLKTPFLSGPMHIDVKRRPSEESVNIEASHDGYARRFGLKHCRSITLSNDGFFLSGQDSVVTMRDRQIATDNPLIFDIRFHLHSQINAEQSSSRTVELILKSGKRWLFNCLNMDVQLEGSISFSKLYGTRQTSQIVISGKLGENSVIDWALQKLS